MSIDLCKECGHVLIGTKCSAFNHDLVVNLKQQLAATETALANAVQREQAARMELERHGVPPFTSGTVTKEEKLFPVIPTRGVIAECVNPHLIRIPWSVAELAYSVYVAKYGRQQSLERLAERGGFHAVEMDGYLPDWRERTSEITQLRAQLAKANADYELLCADNRRLVGCDVREALTEKELVECRALLRELHKHESNGYGKWTAGMHQRVSKATKTENEKDTTKEICEHCGKDVHELESVLMAMVVESEEHDFPSSLILRAANALGIPIIEEGKDPPEDTESY